MEFFLEISDANCRLSKVSFIYSAVIINRGARRYGSGNLVCRLVAISRNEVIILR